MAKRGRKPNGTLTALVRRLEDLDSERLALIAGIRAAADALIGDSGPEPRAPVVQPLADARGDKGRKRPRLSAEARARIAAAQKRRWAEYKRKANK